MRSLGIGCAVQANLSEALKLGSDRAQAFYRDGWRICCSSLHVDVHSARNPAKRVAPRES